MMGQEHFYRLVLLRCWLDDRNGIWPVESNSQMFTFENLTGSDFRKMVLLNKRVCATVKKFSCSCSCRNLLTSLNI